MELIGWSAHVVSLGESNFDSEKGPQFVLERMVVWERLE
jgi:hypothetical protein